MDMNEYLTIKRYLENSLKELKKDLQKEKAHIGNENLVDDQANIKRLQRMVQRECEILEGTLLSRDEVLRQLGEAFHVTKSNLLTIPNTIAGVVAMETDANVIKEIIEGAIRETLVGLRSTILRAGFDRDFDEVASEVDSSSVG